MKNLFLLFLILTAIYGFLPPRKENIELPIKFKDFKTFSSPVTGFQPGYVFRVPKGKMKNPVPVTIIGREIDFNKFDNPVPEMQKSWKTKTFLSFLGIKTLSAKFDNNRENKLSVSFSGGNREQLFDEKIDSLLINSNINFKSGYDYYIINETISFTGMSYALIKYRSLSTSAQNQIDTLKVQGKISIESSKNDTLRFNQNFTTPHRVFYNYLKITKNGSQSSEGKKFILEKTTETVELDDLFQLPE
jgi:hypothetical protein